MAVVDLYVMFSGILLYFLKCTIGIYGIGPVSTGAIDIFLIGNLEVRYMCKQLLKYISNEIISHTISLSFKRYVTPNS